MSWLLALSTLVVFYASLYVVIHIWYPAGLDPARFRLHFIHFTFIYILWMLIFFIHGVFDAKFLRTPRNIILNIVSAMTINLVIAVAYFYFQPNLTLTPRRFLLLHIVFTFVTIVLWLLIVRYILAERLVEHLYVLSVGDDTPNLVGELEQYRFMGIRIVGIIDYADLDQLKVLTETQLVIPDTQHMSPDLLQRLYALRSHSVVLHNYRTLYETLARKVYLTSLNEAWFLENVSYRTRRFYNFFKRAIDMSVGIIGLILLAVVYYPVAMLIKFSSHGPILFKQPRVGQYGTIFTVYKFRTMASEGNPGNTWTTLGDKRITPVGAFLRRARLDELPQVINLVRGNMSLVGPRPEQAHIVDQLRNDIPFYDERHMVKPGVTGWGQLNVYARSVADSAAKLQYDLYYIKYNSLLFDLEIILKTIYHVLTSRDN